MPLAAGKERHQEVEVVIAVRGEGQRREAAFPGVNTQFLLQFADQTGLGRLVPFDLSAGKLPETGHLLALRALRQQDPAFRVDQGDGSHEDNAQER